MKTTSIITPRHEARILSQACDEAARLFFDESFDDYAASAVTYREDGAAVVRSATGYSSWVALSIAAATNDEASALASLDTREGWQLRDMRPIWSAFIQYREIRDADDTLRAVLFKR